MIPKRKPQRRKRCGFLVYVSTETGDGERGDATMKRNEQLSTEELMRLLFMEASLDHLLTKSESSVQLPSFSDYISALCRERGEPAEHVIKRANIEKSFGHQLFTGRRKPSRDTALQLAFGFELDYQGAQALLKAARKNLLYPKVQRDMVVIYCLHHRCDVLECQVLLEQYGLPLLGEGGRNE